MKDEKKILEMLIDQDSPIEWEDVEIVRYFLIRLFLRLLLSRAVLFVLRRISPVQGCQNVGTFSVCAVCFSISKVRLILSGTGRSVHSAMIRYS